MALTRSADEGWILTLTRWRMPPPMFGLHKASANKSTTLVRACLPLSRRGSTKAA
ncbi:hypothetical protein DUNSADRAFT_4755 [Dunaliella salina]|uniref:Encoded protein n=1 Tax=Dunaliella salina TaxID=3046 RepID=A0ABQ7GRH1_DUNSA|nr:hypothetical protein DUNSADRAFT_4755 [Dunaliella salina]|eukprot:KAF5837195.1 hypothetical protein DUNSADRAFT_4755 [Dunaliella salina]